MGNKILITSGPTSVPIDEMRVIANRSTGEMGRLLANAFTSKKARVTLLEGAAVTDVKLSAKVSRKKFYFFNELEKSLKTELQKRPDVVIHAAAVSDFALKKSFKGKLSSADKVKLELVPTRKLVNGIRKACPGVFLVGFKFEPRLDKGYILERTWPLFEDAGCDVVVANSQKAGEYRGYLVWPDGSTSKQVGSRKDLVKLLTKCL